MESLELHTLGGNIFKAFSSVQDSSDRLTSEEQRFRLWAHSLGLHQKGHASLDYRLRDATAVRGLLIEILGELESHLDNLLDVWTGTRPPFEDVEESEDDSSSDRPESRASSESSFHEVDFRLQSVGENLDALYSLAAKIRSPRYRPQRATEQLYKHVPAAIRDEYRREREETEIAIVAYIQRQQLLEALKKPGSETPVVDTDGVVDSYTSPGQWLIRRTGVANARRKQQFVYWKEHADRLKGPVEDAPAAKEKPPEQVPVPAPVQPAIDPSQHLVPQAGSLATSATRLDETFVKLDDLRSVISHESRPSTVVNLKGEKLNWPPPPKQTQSTRFFICPYCKVLCPHRYLSQDAWRVHLIHDLQPYHCTYPDCHNPNRTYGTRQEWLDHENLHLRVWHCQLHGLEFETQPEYVNHLQEAHPDVSTEQLSPELIASVVGPSLEPHRDCPLCPTAFTSIAEMQRHMAFHLERLALYVLPGLDDPDCGDEVSGHSSDTNNAQRRGRGNSVRQDFAEYERKHFDESYPRGQGSGNEDWGSLETLRGEMGHEHVMEAIEAWVQRVKDAQSDFFAKEASYLTLEETKIFLAELQPYPQPQTLSSSSSQEMLGELYKKSLKPMWDGVSDWILSEPSTTKTQLAPTDEHFPYLSHLNGRANFAWRGQRVPTPEGDEVLVGGPTGESADSAVGGEKRGLRRRLRDYLGRRSELR